MPDPKTEEKKKRSPKEGRCITVTLSDEHYEKVSKAAAEDDREVNVWLTRFVRTKLNESSGSKA